MLSSLRNLRHQLSAHRPIDHGILALVRDYTHSCLMFQDNGFKCLFQDRFVMFDKFRNRSMMIVELGL